MGEVTAWHFLASGCRLQYGSRELVEVGKTITVDCKPVLCKSGLHASVRAIDALRYAPGPIACRVHVAGEIVHGDDKLVGTERTVIAMADATNLLHEFACGCAENALTARREKGDEPDPRSWAAIEAKRKWLAGEITDQELDAAWAAAWATALDAARYAAWATAWDAARYSAWSAARDAARDAAWAAAKGAVRDAVWAAAWDAAWAAAGDAQNTELERQLIQLLGVEK